MFFVLFAFNIPTGMDKILRLEKDLCSLNIASQNLRFICFGLDTLSAEYPFYQKGVRGSIGLNEHFQAKQNLQTQMKTDIHIVKRAHWDQQHTPSSSMLFCITPNITC